LSLLALDAAETARALPWVGLIDALRDMLARRRAGATHSPERLVVPIAGGILLTMPATDGEYASTKLVTVCADNPAKALPSLLGEVVLMRAATGERLAMLDGPALTARRTAAMSALAAVTLGAVDTPAASAASKEIEENRRGGRPPVRSMLIIGSGVQAQAHLEVFTEALGIERVLVCSRNSERAEAFARAARKKDIDCTARAESAAALCEVDLVVTGTTSLQPVFEDAPQFQGFVAAVGAFTPQMCELPAALIARARLYIDDKEGGLHEAGDFLQAQVDWRRVIALEEALACGDKPPAGEPVVFKSVGQALWDLAAARLAAEHLGL
jgi:1-piperideine-2-carboxylate/1-pyrroline-2-carboxylate reductase [NAD(P)H]